MKNVLTLFASVMALSSFAAVKEFPWCSVNVPDSVSPGGRFSITVTPKKAVPDGCNISIHMHHVKRNGQWGGMFEWRPAQEFKGVGKALTYNFTAKAGADAKTLNPMMFVAPKGDFNKKVKSFDVNLPAIAYQASAEQIAKAAACAKPDTCTYKKSWIQLSREGGEKGRFYRKGENVTVKVKYYLDPTECWGDGTTLKVIPLGPWIDNPDGTVNKSRTHVYIHGFWPQDKKQLKPGAGEFELTWKVEVAKAPYCEIGFMAQFIGGDGKTFPWQVRGAGFSVLPEANPFRVYTVAPGGLYTYDERPVVKIEGQAAAQADVTITDATGEKVFSGSLPVKDSSIVIPELKKRGTMLCEVTMGNATRYCYFSLIPDVAKALGGKRAPFGCTNVHGEEQAAAAEKMGFRYARLFTPWAGLEPIKGKWNLAGLDKQIDTLNQHGIQPHILLTGAPEWVMPNGVHSPGFEPYPFDDEGWRASATYLAKHYSGRIWGFEWLNEIVQGNKTTQPVEDYVRFCKIGTEAVKAVDPKLQIQMAGGLWPRSYRLDVLRAGIGKYIDVLPVHYSHFDGVAEAKSDFKAGGGKRVMDNESARGYSVWNMDGRKTLLDSVTQSVFVMRQWPGEFISGAESVIYFGGEANACGNWTYLLDDHTPRPVAATLAVMASKLGNVRPVGATYLDPGALVYLFERKDGKGLAFVMSQTEKSNCTVNVPVGNVTGVRQTDFCGNETELMAQGGKLQIEAKPLPVILEGFDYGPLAAACSLSIAGQGPLTPLPGVRLVTGGTAKVQATVRNPYAKAASGVVAVKCGQAKSKPQSFTLKPGATTFLDFDLGPVSEDMAEGAVAISFKEGGKFSRKFAVNLINPDLLGSLVKNGNFETPGGKLADGWGSGGFKYIELDGKAPGYEGHAIEMSNTKGYVSAWQSFKLPAPGIRYLYTAWVWSDGAYCGSNASVSGPQGKKEYSIPHCFAAPKKTKGWVLLSKILDAIPGSNSASTVPCGTGNPAVARYDNIRVTAYEGTDFATEAYRLTGALKIDGDLSDWNTANPIPLCCENEVTETKNGYEWSRENVSGVAYLAWDKEALYFAAKVLDDQHTTEADDKSPFGDSITLALHPGNRVPGTDAQAQEWFISDRNPGGGSGKYTLYRPAAHAAGLKSGQLAKDSSNYDIVVKTTGSTTVYEVRIPWSEIRGCTPEVGAKLGLSLRLSDRDGQKFGRLNWGMGLDPAWAPTAFGSLTLTK